MKFVKKTALVTLGVYLLGMFSPPEKHLFMGLAFVGFCIYLHGVMISMDLKDE